MRKKKKRITVVEYKNHLLCKGKLVATKVVNNR